MRASIARVVSGRAGPPQAGVNFTPLYSGGLWLAVIVTAPASPRRITWKATAGVGVAASQRSGRSPPSASAFTAT